MWKIFRRYVHDCVVACTENSAPFLYQSGRRAGLEIRFTEYNFLSTVIRDNLELSAKQILVQKLDCPKDGQWFALFANIHDLPCVNDVMQTTCSSY